MDKLKLFNNLLNESGDSQKMKIFIFTMLKLVKEGIAEWGGAGYFDDYGRDAPWSEGGIGSRDEAIKRIRQFLRDVKNHKEYCEDEDDEGEELFEETLQMLIDEMGDDFGCKYIDEIEVEKALKKYFNVKKLWTKSSKRRPNNFGY